MIRHNVPEPWFVAPAHLWSFSAGVPRARGGRQLVALVGFGEDTLRRWRIYWCSDVSYEHGWPISELWRGRKPWMAGKEFSTALLVLPPVCSLLHRAGPSMMPWEELVGGQWCPRPELCFACVLHKLGSAAAGAARRRRRLPHAASPKTIPSFHMACCMQWPC